MKNPTTIELGDNDSIVITKNGKVIGMVELHRERNNAVELCAYPVTFSNWRNGESIFNSFSTTMAINVERLEDLDSAENFLAFVKKAVA